MGLLHKKTDFNYFIKSTSVIKVFPEPLFSGGQVTPSFENRGPIEIFEDQLELTPSG